MPQIAGLCGPFPRILSYQQITAPAVATGLIIPAGTSFAEVQVSVQAVRFRADGTAPTASVGMPIAVGDLRTFPIANLSALQFIEQAAGAVLNVTYYGL